MPPVRRVAPGNGGVKAILHGILAACPILATRKFPQEFAIIEDCGGQYVMTGLMMVGTHSVQVSRRPTHRTAATSRQNRLDTGTRR